VVETAVAATCETGEQMHGSLCQAHPTVYALMSEINGSNHLGEVVAIITFTVVN
jgi:hypothetical protein